MNGMQICVYMWAGWIVIWLLWAIRTKPAQVREGFSSRMSYTIATVAAFFAMFTHDLQADWMNWRLFPPHAWVAYLGIAITAAGLLFALWARMHLGGNWSGTVTVKVDHKLIRTGPYRFVRHPIYSGMVLAMIGTALERRQVRGLVAVVLLYIGFSIKRRIEDGYMMATFGSEYQDYMRSTGALFPRL